VCLDTLRPDAVSSQTELLLRINNSILSRVQPRKSILVEPVGIEPTTSSLQSWRSPI
jgi:hypothetical protein